ncbi:hypothetical protein [Trueperella pyogenes]|uniref:hypothetical protein n=1 Tax=Trueperella pyogenes TaxID=1661 RepID=UPI00345DE9CE
MVKQRAKAELTFKYEGAAVADGTMDMADFGRALIGYTKVVDAVVKQLNPKSTVTEVRLEKTEKGSFTVIGLARKLLTVRLCSSRCYVHVGV